VTRRLGKNGQIFENVAKIVAKCQNIIIKAKFESPKHLYQTPSKLLKYLISKQTILGFEK
jgi:hypothetical protein